MLSSMPKVDDLGTMYVGEYMRFASLLPTYTYEMYLKLDFSFVWGVMYRDKLNRVAELNMQAMMAPKK